MRSLYFGAGALADLDSLREQFNGLFRAVAGPANLRAASAGYPPVTVGTTSDAVEIVVLAPGLASDAIQVTWDDGLLCIEGERQADVQAAGNVLSRERSLGKFRRTVELPQDADPDRIQAQYQDGCLRITVQRKRAPQPRQIPVH